MESFLALFVHHDTYVVSFLVVGITIVVVLLLLYSQKSPESVVKSELSGSDNIEGALRRVLGEQRWMQAGAAGESSAGGDPEKLGALEQEVLAKDRTIAELNKQLTKSGPTEAGAGPSGDDSDLMNRISELEARLEEYEIIEDDIADLSLYKTENEKLKAELGRLKGLAGVDIIEEPAETPGQTKIDDTPSDEASEATFADESPESEDVSGADLVAEFEKVVNNQEQMDVSQDSSHVSVEKDGTTGKVLMADDFGPKKVSQEPQTIHPKLKNVDPDSKEEAEVFITELKSLKSVKKGD